MLHGPIKVILEIIFNFLKYLKNKNFEVLKILKTFLKITNKRTLRI